MDNPVNLWMNRDRVVNNKISSTADPDLSTFRTWTDPHGATPADQRITRFVHRIHSAYYYC
ncbi:hypothetical protein BTZ20_5906 [Rhodococcus sp. MTM3W5.2]|nr:hypothetical protein BTZ20_5906 [Rhodococcus sp. MTM3W5.2]